MLLQSYACNDDVVGKLEMEAGEAYSEAGKYSLIFSGYG